MLTLKFIRNAKVTLTLTGQRPVRPVADDGFEIMTMIPNFTIFLSLTCLYLNFSLCKYNNLLDFHMISAVCLLKGCVKHFCKSLIECTMEINICKKKKNEVIKHSRST